MTIMLIGRLYWKLKRLLFEINIERYFKKYEIIITNYLQDNNLKQSCDCVYSNNSCPNQKRYEIIGEIDEHGRIMSDSNLKNRESVNKDQFVKRRKNTIYLCKINDEYAIIKDYRGDKIRFVKELRGLYRSMQVEANVPSIHDVDFEKLIIIISFIEGTPLYEIDNISTYKSLIFEQVKKIHSAGIYLNDLSQKNILISDGIPFIIDFEESSNKDELGPFFKLFTESEIQSIDNIKY